MSDAGRGPKTPSHPILKRQLRRLAIDLSEGVDPRWLELVERVDAAYKESDASRYILERSLELSSREMQELNSRLAAERQRLAGELEIAMHMQTSILPHQLSVRGFEAVARMVPASEVGGDYYDLVPTDDGCWLAIGDVAGHGLGAAVIMTMVQSMVSALVRQATHASPRDILLVLNQAVHENVFRRLERSDHVTLTLLRCRPDGSVTFAGAHETLLVYRDAVGTCEAFDTPGSWLGPSDDIGAFTRDSEIRLGPRDILVLYTDGVIEAKNATHGARFGLGRLRTAIEERRGAALAELCSGVVDQVRAWSGVPEDDLTLLLFRRSEQKA